MKPAHQTNPITTKTTVSAKNKSIPKSITVSLSPEKVASNSKMEKSSKLISQSTGKQKSNLKIINNVNQNQKIDKKKVTKQNFTVEPVPINPKERNKKHLKTADINNNTSTKQKITQNNKENNVSKKQGKTRESQPIGRSRENEALNLFSIAIKAFNDSDFEQAKNKFEILVNNFTEESEIIARAKTFQRICNQRLFRTKSTNKGAENLYNQGVIELNQNELDRATIFFEKALRQDSALSYVRYSLAATQARQGLAEKALENLRQCINQDKIYRVRIQNDTDFESLHENDDFCALIDSE